MFSLSRRFTKQQRMSSAKFNNMDYATFIKREGPNNSTHNYRPKVLFGKYIVLKETKDGSQVKKFEVDSWDVAESLANKINNYKTTENGKTRSNTNSQRFVPKPKRRDH